MIVFLALMTITGKRGPQLLDARHHVEGILVGKDDVGHDDIACPFAHPAPQSGRGAGGAHRIAGARQGLRHDGPDSAVIIRNEYRFGLHALPSSVWFCWAARIMGRSTRKVVPRSCGSHSTIPPWSRTILATRARPEAATAGFGADERIEEMRPEIGGHARSRIPDTDLERQGHALAGGCDR